MFPDHNYIIKCIDDNNPAMPILRTLRSGGTAIMWKKDLDNII